MSSLIKPLLVLLVVQLLVWAFLQFSGSGSSATAPPLLDAAIENTEGLVLEIKDAQGNSAQLSRIASGWQLSSGLPADSAKADALLTKLQTLNLRWPVSTSASSHERFEVAADNFQRQLTLSGDGLDATLFFGTSPGYQQVHARGEGDSVYAVRLANYELPGSNDEWLDKSLLHAVGDVSSVSWGSELSVVKESAGWMLAGSSVNQEDKGLANIAATDVAVNGIAKIQVLGVLDSAPSAAPEDAKVILLGDADGEFRLSYWPREANNDYVVMSTRFPGEAFRMANFVAEQLMPDATKLVAPKLPEIDMQDAQSIVPGS